MAVSLAVAIGVHRTSVAAVCRRELRQWPPAGVRHSTMMKPTADRWCCGMVQRSASGCWQNRCCCGESDLFVVGGSGDRDRRTCTWRAARGCSCGCTPVALWMHAQLRSRANGLSTLMAGTCVQRAVSQAVASPRYGVRGQFITRAQRCSVQTIRSTCPGRGALAAH